MKNILVTGGAGYIGSICAAQLLAKGYSVIVVDDLSTGFPEAVPPGVSFYRADSGDRPAIRQILSRCPVDIVFHFAAKALIPESVSNPGMFFDANVASGIILLEELRRAGVHKFVFSSSAAVYGNPDCLPIAEDHPKQPITSYGETKWMFEQILAWYARAYGWGIAALRYFNACGASAGMGERHDPETHLIPRLLQAVSGDLSAVEIFGTDYATPDGTCLRDYVHVLDIADAHIRTMRILDTPGMTVFNIGTGRSHSVKEVLETAEKVSGRPIPMILRGRRSGDPAVLCASPTKLIKTLGWQPIHSDLTSIVQSAWEFHRKSQQRHLVDFRHDSSISLTSTNLVQRDEVP
jgi:UDP-glucose 4-epimerase